MFEKASKMKLRFDTVHGRITIEDLWDMPLTDSDFSLDTLAKQINKKVKESGEESFVKPSSVARLIPELSLEIVKRVIAVRLEEIDQQKARVATKARKDRIMAILEDKEDDSLKEKSADELRELLEEDLGCN